MRVAERVNNVWRYMIYDIGGKLVAEYGGVPATQPALKYIMQDWQGSTRAVVNAAGFVQGRMDYTAFGEDIAAGVGLRTTTQGFGSTNLPRQKYALTERDDATGLDHTWFRKNENRAGRWTSPDPYSGSMRLGDPQSFNRYSYVENQPTNFIDPTGLCRFNIFIRIGTNQGQLQNVGTYGTQAVINAARAEITRIFGQAGHTVSFNSSGAGADGSYTASLVSGRSQSGNALGDTYAVGYPGGRIYTGALTNFALRNIYSGNGTEGYTNAGMGLGLGRVIAHETVTHYLLSLSNAQHTASGLTRASFGGNLFSSAAASAYNIPISQAAELRNTCLPSTSPNNVAGGGGGGGSDFNGGYNGGGGYPSWWASLQAFLNWVNSIPVGNDVRTL